MQSEAVSLAYRTWRREWRGKGKQFVSGYRVVCLVLVAQLNVHADCRCLGVATERLLARHLLGHRGLFRECQDQAASTVFAADAPMPF